MSTRRTRAIAPEEIVRRLLGLEPDLRLAPYYGERAIFYNPGDVKMTPSGAPG